MNQPTSFHRDIFTEEALKAHDQGDIYIMNVDQPEKGINVAWSLPDIIENGYLENRPPTSLSHLMRLLTSLLRMGKNEWSGTQTINALDSHLAQFITSKNLTLKQVKKELVTFTDSLNNENSILSSISLNLIDKKNQEAVDLFNEAFLQVLRKQYSSGNFYPIPIINLTNDVNWGNPTLSKYIELSFLYGYPNFQNYKTSVHQHVDLEKELKSIDTSYLHLRHGGIFGNLNYQGTSSKIYINLPRIAYKSDSEEDFFFNLNEIMDLIKKGLIKHRGYQEELLKTNQIPLTKEKLGSYSNCFLAISIVGMNEALHNLINAGITHIVGKAVTYKVLETIIDIIESYQKETGCLYSIDGTPSSVARHHFITKDEIQFKNQTNSLTNKNYTDATELPNMHIDDVWESIEHQKKIHTIYNGGTIFQLKLENQVNFREECKLLLSRITEIYGFPFIAISPKFTLTKPSEETGEPLIYDKNDGIISRVDDWAEWEKEEHEKRHYHDVKIK
jgi:ribonucleoside-triphosphate reductase